MTFWKARNLLGWMYISVTFLIMAIASILVRVGHLEAIPVTHRVPTAEWRIVVRNCCGDNICLKERHHLDYQFVYKNVTEEESQSHGSATQKETNR